MRKLGANIERLTKAEIIANPPELGVVKYAYDSNEYGYLDSLGTLVWKLVDVTIDPRVLAMYNCSVIDTDYTAVDNDYLLVDTTNNSVSVTLPITPQPFTRVRFVDAAGQFSVNNLVILRNGSTIMNLTEDLIVDSNNVSFELIYSGSDWRIA